MLSELLGLKLCGVIPDIVLKGLLSGDYKSLGGVVVDNFGKIVLNIVEPNNSNMSLGDLFPNQNALSELYYKKIDHIDSTLDRVDSNVSRVDSNVSKLLDQVKINSYLSGLNLAVSVAGFALLSNRLCAIDKKLNELCSDVKSIKRFLALSEHSRLISALRDTQRANGLLDPSTKIPILVQSRQVLGEIHEKYKALISESNGVYEIAPIEEYFIITAIGHSLCSAELGMFEQAKADLEDAKALWKKSVRSFVNTNFVGNKPQRLLSSKYAPYVKSSEIIEWISFAKDKKLGVDIFDMLRSDFSIVGSVELGISKKLSREEELSINISRKFVERDKVLDGYIAQHNYYASIKQKPSDVKLYLDGVSPSHLINGFYVFVSNDIA